MKSALSTSLEFYITLVADEYEYASVSGFRSRITNVILVDDQGRRFAAVSKDSLDPKFDDYGGKLGATVFNIVAFPINDTARQPIITPTTKYIDIFVVSAAGKAKFHFDFED
jgi:hypothetical protein